MKSKDLKSCCRRMLNAGYANAEVCRILGVSRTTIWRWNRVPDQVLSTTGTIGRPRQLSARELEACQTFILDNASIRHVDVATFVKNRFDKTVSKTMVYRIFQRLGITRKRVTKRYDQQDEGKVQAFLSSLPPQSTSEWLALDECGFVMNHVPSYGYSPRGKRAVVSRPGPRGKRFSLLLCISPCGVVRSSLVQGGFKSPEFRDFLQALPVCLTISMDNASIHHATKSLQRLDLPTILETAQSREQTLVYLPAYSPQLNPTELCFNTLRTSVHRACPRNEADLRQAVGQAILSLTPEVCKSFFRHCWERPRQMLSDDVSPLTTHTH